MTVGRLTGAEYEFTHHWNMSLTVGVKREQLEHLAEFETSPVFDSNERAVMRYAVEATRDVKVSDATFDALRGFLDNRRIMDLVMNVAFYNAVARVIVPLRRRTRGRRQKELNQDSSFRRNLSMAARLPYIDREGLPESDRDIYDKLVQERGAGPVGNIFRTLANAPNLLRRFNALGGELRNKTQLDPKLRELALMTVGRLTDAEYEFTHHWNISLRVGIPREQLEHLAQFETSPLFNAEERAVMRYAVEATCEVKVSDATFTPCAGFSIIAASWTS